MTGTSVKETYGISIQVNLGGYSFKVTSSDGQVLESGSSLSCGEMLSSGVMAGRYRECSLVLRTARFTLVPLQMLEKDGAEEYFYKLFEPREGERIMACRVPYPDAAVVYAVPSSDKVVEAAGSVFGAVPEPEACWLLRRLQTLDGFHNRVIASYEEGLLTLAVAEGERLLLCCGYDAPDFVTALYFIFMALKEFQFNPEVTVIHFRDGIGEEEQMMLYKYFNGVEVLQ